MIIGAGHPGILGFTGAGQAKKQADHVPKITTCRFTFRVRT